MTHFLFQLLPQNTLLELPLSVNSLEALNVEVQRGEKVAELNVVLSCRGSTWTFNLVTQWAAVLYCTVLYLLGQCVVTTLCS